ncbi:MAG: winged helix-turn-helix domain-containing protein [Desulfovibrio sp.]
MAWTTTAILNALAEGPQLTRQLMSRFCKDRESMRRCLGYLRQRGFLASAEGVHQITDKGRQFLAEGRTITSGPCGGNTASRRGPTLRQRAWRLMRMRDGFSVADLLRTLCDSNEGDPERNLRRYIAALEAAGFLTPFRRRGEGGAKRWYLRREMNTGPEAPALNTRAKRLTDHNTGKIFGLGHTSQEAAHVR